MSRPACLPCLAVWGKDSPAVRRMQKNHVTALTVIAGAVDIDRFGSPEKLVSYAGIAPSQRGSGEAVKTCRITKQGSMWLRNATVGAASSAIPHGVPVFYGTRAARLCRARECQQARDAPCDGGVPEVPRHRGDAESLKGGLFEVARGQYAGNGRSGAGERGEPHRLPVPPDPPPAPMRAGRSWRP